MQRANFAWREVCALALREADPEKLTMRIERAMAAIERRYAEWASNPGTPNELRLIRKTISHLERLVQKKVLTKPSVDVRISAARTAHSSDEGIATEFDRHIKQLVSLRSTSSHQKQIRHKAK
jgi:translation initiation factor 2 beta subunit (eIF-2beta)/eIF-5